MSQAKVVCPKHHVAVDAHTGCEDCYALAREAMALEEPMLMFSNVYVPPMPTLEEMKATMDDLLKRFPPCEHEYHVVWRRCIRCDAEQPMDFRIDIDANVPGRFNLVWRIPSV